MSLTKTRQSNLTRHILNAGIFTCLVALSITGVQAAESAPMAHAPAKDYSQAAAHLQDGLSEAALLNNQDFYQVELLGAVYLFDDAKTYQRFLADGHVGERRFVSTDNDDGRTVVAVVSEQDRGIQSKTAAEKIYSGELQGANEFYAEVVVDRQVRRFHSWAAFQQFQQRT